MDREMEDLRMRTLGNYMLTYRTFRKAKAAFERAEALAKEVGFSRPTLRQARKEVDENDWGGGD